MAITNLTAEDSIREFKRIFQLTYGIEVFVVAKGSRIDFPKISLKNLEIVINEQLEKNFPGKWPEGIKTKRRKRDLTTLRACFYKIALDMGYTLHCIGDFIDIDHATVLHGNRTLCGLLIINAKEATINLNTIYHELKTRFGIDADIPTDSKTKFKS